MKKTAIVLAGLLGACGSDGGSPAPPQQPVATATPTPTPTPAPTKENFVVIMVDDLLLSDFLSTTATPTLNEMASQGVVFSNFHTTTPVCTPSRYTLLTGRRASESQSDAMLRRIERDGMPVPEFNAKIIEGEDTLPKRLKAAGYTTGFVGKNHVVDVDGLPDFPSPATLDDPEVRAALKEKDEIVRATISRVGFDFVARVLNEGSHNKTPVPELRVHNLDWIAEGAIKFIEAKKDQPFFLYMALTIPHTPDGPASSWAADRRYTPNGVLDQAPGLLLSAAELTAKAPGKENLLWMDDAVRVVREALSANELLENTTIIFLSDHGQAAKGSIYDAGTRTPALVWRDDIARGNSNSLVSNLDLAPTLLALAGDESSGSGFAPLLVNPALQIHDALLFDLGYTRGVLKNDWKYIAFRLSERLRDGSPPGTYYHFTGRAGGGAAERNVASKYPHYFDPDQLYYLKTDPNEQKNLYGTNANSSTVADLKAELTAEFGGSFAEF